MSMKTAPKQSIETRPAVERIGTFAASVRSKHLTIENRQLFKRNILDSIGCAIAAVAGGSLKMLREQIEEYRAPGRCTLIGGGKTSPDQAHSQISCRCRAARRSSWARPIGRGEDLRNRLIQVVQQLDARPISDLTDLLAQVRCTATFPRTHPGIQ